MTTAPTKKHSSSRLSSMRYNFSEGDMNRYVEEDAITEMGQVSVLSASSFSLKHRAPVHLDKKTSIYVTSQLEINEEDEIGGGVESKEEKKKMTKLEMIRHMRGFIYVVIYALFFALSGIFIKRAYLLAGSDNSVIRYVLQLITMFALTKLKGISCFGPKEQWCLLSLRGFIGQLSVMALHFSLTLIAPSDTIAITNSSLIVASVLAWLFLKEKLTVAHIVAVFFTITGVVLISQPTFIFGEKGSSAVVVRMFNCSLEQVGLVGVNRSWPISSILEGLEEKLEDDSTTSAVQIRCLNALIDQYTIKLVNITEHGVDHYDHEADSSIMYILEHAPNIKRSSLLFYLGIFFALVYSFGSGAVQVIIKKLCMQKVHFAVATIYSSYFGIPCSMLVSAGLFLTGTSHKHFNYELHFHLLPLQIFYSIASALCGIFSQVCLNLALNYEDASKISILKSLDLLFTFALQFFILRIEPDLMSCAGAALILAGSTAVVGYKIFENKRKQKKLKQKSKADALLKASQKTPQ